MAYAHAAARLAELTRVAAHDVAVVLGSGWVAAADAIGATEAETAVTNLPGLAPPAVPGHAGVVRSVEAGGRRTAAAAGW